MCSFRAGFPWTNSCSCNQTCLIVVRPLQYNSLFLITVYMYVYTCSRMEAGSEYHYYISNSLTLVHVKTIITTLPALRYLSEPCKHPRIEGISCTPLAIRLHSRTPSSCSAHWLSNTCKSYWPWNSINYRKCCLQQTVHAQFSPRLQVVWEQVPQTWIMR